MAGALAFTPPCTLDSDILEMVSLFNFNFEFLLFMFLILIVKNKIC